MGMQLAIVHLVLMSLATAGFVLTAPTLTEAGLAQTNVTVIMKNRNLPLKAQITMEPCAVEVCVEI